MEEFKKDPERQIGDTDGILYRAMLSRHKNIEENAVSKGKIKNRSKPIVIRSAYSPNKIIYESVDDESAIALKKWRSEQRKLVLKASMDALVPHNRQNFRLAHYPLNKRGVSARPHFTQVKSKRKKLSPLQRQGLQLLAQRSKAEISLSRVSMPKKKCCRQDKKSYSDCWMRKLRYLIKYRACRKMVGL